MWIWLKQKWIQIIPSERIKSRFCMLHFFTWQPGTTTWQHLEPCYDHIGWPWDRLWRDAKKWNREEKYGNHISNFEKRKEKCRDLFSGSRREREFMHKQIEKSAIFSNFEKRKRNFEIKSHDARGDRDVEISNFSWRERGIHRPPFTFIFLFFFLSLKLKIISATKRSYDFWCPIPE